MQHLWGPVVMNASKTAVAPCKRAAATAAKFDGNAVTAAAYERLWEQSVEQYGIVFGTDNPDLTAFRDRGGKAIVWHGWADQLISAEGTVDASNFACSAGF